MRSFGRLAILFALVCGLAASQEPEFLQQYEQRLGGALDEIRSILARFDAEAAAVGLSRAQAITRLESNSDGLARLRGDDIARIASRERRLSSERDALRQAGPAGQLVIVVEDLDPEIAAGAFRAFRPAVPLSLPSAVAGLIGFALGLAGWHGVAWTASRRRRRLREADPTRT
jgi:hypothetical protein